MSSLFAKLRRLFKFWFKLWFKLLMENQLKYKFFAEGYCSKFPPTITEGGRRSGK